MYSHLRPAARKFTTQLFHTSTSTNLKRVAVPVPLTVTPIASHKRLIHTSRARSEMDTTSNATTKADPAPAASSTSPVPGSTSPMNTVTDAPESTTAPTVEVEEEATSTDPTLSRPTQYAPEITDDSDPLADPLSVESQKLQNNNNPLPLPSPETATHVPPEEQPKVVTVNGQAVALDNLGPMVVHKDGTISRIANWHEMTDIEQESTLRILGKRNQLRLTNLREGRVNGEGM
ncbi:hypothetical protein B0H65DRAFT_492872 [Neurospora tetraspora]|uniref:Uncharacterized protein n=1 Tax=Neurospora tetraspora TaxID=94610 RepID=A0AAE0JER9_9PEZI|nr:hypothetical protein B0H65DRAFT_492872 [Neurospora tetraspora]